MTIKPTDRDLPVDYSKIEDNLYLGNIMAAYDKEMLRKNGIKRVLTVRDVGIDESGRLPDVEYLQICLTDNLQDDLLTHFAVAHQFIDDGLRQGQPVYVHCRLGQSRSVTIVVGYIMRRDKLDYNEALRRVKAKRPKARPNNSFEFQLKLFKEMNYGLDPMNVQFRQYLLTRLTYVLKKKIINKTTDPDMTIVDKFFEILGDSGNVDGTATVGGGGAITDGQTATADSGQTAAVNGGGGGNSGQTTTQVSVTAGGGPQTTASKTSAGKTTTVVSAASNQIAVGKGSSSSTNSSSSAGQTTLGNEYKCRKCQKVLFNEIQVVRDFINASESRYKCDHIFTEPIKWMPLADIVYQQPSGDLKCPQCSAKCGQFDWCNNQCQCILHQKIKQLCVFKFFAKELNFLK
ncbi:dual specificity protein phosphatase 12-like [Oppia nitens]|uniref:dual specificity protein phosphatase 12-like n=1 Tax=Oppia nitens TaxID=1686743 RepID=UPI0023DC1AD4|nr:dual specificity protein phosphatase 12-like [Oppia nitens]